MNLPVTESQAWVEGISVKLEKQSEKAKESTSDIEFVEPTMKPLPANTEGHQESSEVQAYLGQILDAYNQIRRERDEVTKQLATANREILRLKKLMASLGKKLVKDAGGEMREGEKMSLY